MRSGPGVPLLQADSGRIDPGRASWRRVGTRRRKRLRPERLPPTLFPSPPSSKAAPTGPVGDNTRVRIYAGKVISLIGWAIIVFLGVLAFIVAVGLTRFESHASRGWIVIAAGIPTGVVLVIAGKTVR